MKSRTHRNIAVQGKVSALGIKISSEEWLRGAMLTKREIALYKGRASFFTLHSSACLLQPPPRSFPCRSAKDLWF